MNSEVLFVAEKVHDPQNHADSARERTFLVKSELEAFIGSTRRIPLNDTSSTPPNHLTKMVRQPAAAARCARATLPQRPPAQPLAEDPALIAAAARESGACIAESCWTSRRKYQY